MAFCVGPPKPLKLSCLRSNRGLVRRDLPDLQLNAPDSGIPCVMRSSAVLNLHTFVYKDP